MDGYAYVNAAYGRDFKPWQIVKVEFTGLMGHVIPRRGDGDQYVLIRLSDGQRGRYHPCDVEVVE